MTEWLDIMLGELDRRRQEQAEAEAEAERRHDGKVENGAAQEK